jgi:hypothetical protein
VGQFSRRDQRRLVVRISPEGLGQWKFTIHSDRILAAEEGEEVGGHAGGPPNPMSATDDYDSMVANSSPASTALVASRSAT